MKPFNPKSTVFTNEMLDIIMPRVSPSEWKILCLAMRKTAGWQDSTTESGRKESDVISLTQFEKGCGMSRHTVIEAIDNCLNAGYLIREPDGLSFRYRLNTDYELSTGAEIAPVVDSTSAEIALVSEKTSAKSAQTNSNNINSKDHARTKEEMMEMTRQSLRKFEEKHGVLPNVKNYPEDVIPIIEKVCAIWRLSVPPIKEDRGYWIRGARELMTACEGHPDVVLEEIKRDLDTRPARNHVIISSPNSLIQMARAKVGELKRKAESKASIPRGASEVWIGGEKYTP